VTPRQTLFHHQLGFTAWLCVADHLTWKPLHRKRDKHHFYFLKPLQIQNLKRKKWGGHGILCPPRLKKWGGHVPRVPHQIAPMLEFGATIILLSHDQIYYALNIHQKLKHRKQQLNKKQKGMGKHGKKCEIVQPSLFLKWTVVVLRGSGWAMAPQIFAWPQFSS